MLKLRNLCFLLLTLAAFSAVYLRFKGYYTLYFWIAAAALLLLLGRMGSGRGRAAWLCVTILAALAVAWQIAAHLIGWGAPPLWSAALGALVAALSTVGLDLLLTRVLNKPPLFGGYATALIGCGGFLLGWQLALLALLLGIFLGGLSPLLRTKAKKEVPVDYTPFFAAAILLSGLYGPSFLQWYVSP